MPRELSAPLAALVASGHRRQHVALDVTLRDGTQFHLATGVATVGPVAYDPGLDEVEAMQLSLFADDDSQSLKAQNVDGVLGLTMTGQTNMLAGAKAVSGVIFKDPSTNETFYDERMPGVLLASNVTAKHVELVLVDEVYATVISGVSVTEEFPVRDAPPAATRPDPDDLLPPRVPTDPDLNLPGGDGGFRGRYLMPSDIFGVN